MSCDSRNLVLKNKNYSSLSDVSVDLNCFHNVDLSDNKLTELFSTDFFNKIQVAELILDRNVDLKASVEIPFLRADNLTLLSCENCGFYGIYQKSFTGLKMIEKISLKSNSISTIDVLAFNECDNLKILNLDKNLLHEISSQLFIKNLIFQNLYLSSNTNLKPSSTEETFLESSSLNILECNNCGFTVITNETFKKLNNLMQLSLSYNKISKIDAGALTNCEKLEKIDLEGNEITEISHTILDRLKSLKSLCLDKNSFNTTYTENSIFQKLYKSRKLHSTDCLNNDESLFYENITFLEWPPIIPNEEFGLLIGFYIAISVIIETFLCICLTLYVIKLKKFDRNAKIDQYAKNIINNNRIYRME